MSKVGIVVAIVVLAGRIWASDTAGVPGSTRPAAHESTPLPASARQLLVVRSASWTATTGTLQRYARDPDKPWKPVAVATDVNVGRRGMAWGRGLHAPQDTGPMKKEGDQKSPAGAFLLGQAFGYDDGLPEGAHGYPYLHIAASTSCIEDANSHYYNQVIDPATVSRADWSERDSMRRPDGLFRWGIVVAHNAGEPERGAGSCIFLHIWRGLGKGTAGCTAMPQEFVEELVRWLEPGSHPVLVQLPEAQYERLRSSWVLP